MFGVFLFVFSKGDLHDKPNAVSWNVENIEMKSWNENWNGNLKSLFGLPQDVSLSMLSL